MALPKLLTAPDERSALVAMLYELGDCLSAVATYALVFDGPLSGIDIDELMLDIATDVTDALALITAIGPLLNGLVESPWIYTD